MIVGLYMRPACMVEHNKHRSAEHDSCPTCKQNFIGRLQMHGSISPGAGWIMHAHRSHDTFDPAATGQLAAAKFDHGKYEEAMTLFQAKLAYEKRFGYNHLDMANTYN